MGLTGKVALGANHETVDVAGATVLTSPNGARTVLPGGLLALASNSGHFDRNEFAVLPELDFNVGYQVTSHARVFVGYTFLYCSNVVRPGDQIDLAFTCWKACCSTRWSIKRSTSGTASTVILCALQRSTSTNGGVGYMRAFWS